MKLQLKVSELMANTENKTKATTESVDEFLDSVTDEQQKTDAKVVCKMMTELSGEPPKMWGSAIIGFGSAHYKYKSGREGDMPRIGFSPRKQNLTLYLVNEYKNSTELFKKLGKHSTSKACLYVKRLSDIDMAVLKELIENSLEYMRESYK